jgi:hypothetical protein
MCHSELPDKAFSRAIALAFPVGGGSELGGGVVGGGGVGIVSELLVG